MPEEQNIAKPWMLAPTPDELQELPGLTVQSFVAAARSFKRRTGIGADAVHPRAFASLSEEGTKAVVHILQLIEQSGVWPQRLSHVYYFLIPKLGGGLRPIGLLPSLVRIWERMRRPIVSAWMQRQARSYDWAAVGKTAEDAAWQQLARAEGVDCTQDEPNATAVTTVLLDMVKCLEKVRLIHVWRWGKYWGVPAGLLKLLLQVFLSRKQSSSTARIPSQCTQ